MKEREKQRDECEPAAPGSDPGNDMLDAVGDEAARLLAAGDDAIDRALSGDSRAFLRANRQQGGE